MRHPMMPGCASAGLTVPQEWTERQVRCGLEETRQSSSVISSTCSHYPESLRQQDAQKQFIAKSNSTPAASKTLGKVLPIEVEWRVQVDSPQASQADDASTIEYNKR